MRVTLTDNQLSAFLREASIGGAKIEAIVAHVKCRHAVKTTDEEEDGVAMAVANAIGGYRDKLQEACRDPVTDEVMNDAVIVNAPCKHTVKMTTFQEWVGKHCNNTCPSCGSVLWSTGVMPNKPLREVIEILQGNVTEVSATKPRSVTPTPPESPHQPVVRFLDDECWGNYLGELNDLGQRHGHGAMEWENGARYEGDWENDAFEGKGKLTHYDGSVYEGEFKEHLEDGQGKLTYLVDGLVYEGELKEDFPERLGKNVLPGSIVEGTFIKGELDGIATETFADGAMCFCRFVSGSAVNGVCWSGDRNQAKRLWWNPSGCLEEKNISLVEAEAIAAHFGLPVPQITEFPPQPVVRFLDNECWGNYVGELNDQGQRHGHGVMEWENGIRYEGDWENDLREGNGKLMGADGFVYYEGEFKKDFSHGLGKLFIPLGSIVEGTFVEGKLHGIVTKRRTDGEIQFCRYESGSPVEGVCWSGNREEAKRLWWNSSGDYENESISLEEAEAIATRFGVPVPEPSTGLNM